jgi:hypothetical protein
MNIILPHLITTNLITQDIIVRCVSSLSTSILSSYNLYNFITTHSNSDYQIYQNEIISTDLANKLLVASSLIKDVIKRHHFSNPDDFNMSIEKIMELYKMEIKVEESEFEEDGFNIITHIQNNSIISDVAEPVKIVLNSTLEIIDKINDILNKIHIKIKTHSNSYIKYVSKLNISIEVIQLMNLDKIFDKRLKLLLEILKIYSDVVKSN